MGNYRHVPTVQIGMDLKIEDYEWALFKINEMAQICCDGRIVSMLEGGYGSYEKDKASGEVVLGRYPLTQLFIIRTSLAQNVAGHMHGLLGETPASPAPHKKTPSPNGAYCGCGQVRDEEMIECAVGRKCGGWVHFSCAGVDFENYKEDEKEPFICRWCRAEGVSLNDTKKEKKEGSKSPTRKPRVKKEGE